jgi:hypothetical protein
VLAIGYRNLDYIELNENIGIRCTSNLQTVSMIFWAGRRGKYFGY